VSDASQGPGWWIASDGRWYPPELHPDCPAPPAAAAPSIHYGFGPMPPASEPAPTDSLATWAPSVAPPVEAPVVPGYPIAGGSTDPHGYQSPAGSPPPIGYPPTTPVQTGGRFSRGLRLVGIGFTMARDEPGLLLVPVVAFLLQLAVAAVGFLVVWPGLRTADAANGGTVHLTAADWLVAVVVGVALMFISVVSHATIIARVMARFHGQRITNSHALRAALTKAPHLLAWAFINYVVISVLRNISNRGILGLLVGTLLRVGWLLASFFVVPVILFENRGAAASIKRSVELCRGRWGENIVGNSALGIIGFVAILADVAVAVLVGAVFAPLGAIVGVLGLACILLVLTVASAAFNAALYWYAITNQSPGQYSVGDLQSAYRHKSGRSGAFGF
jgi:hypothetical protein